MKKTVLVVDDEPDIVELLSYNLRKEGYNVITAADGRSAIEQAASGPDLIILDVMMPEIDGFEVCRRLKSTERSRNIPVIFLTARSGEFEEILGLEIGADDFVQKPISPRKLLVRVKAVLRRRRPDTGQREESPIIQVGDLRIDRSSYSVRLGSKDLSLPKKEFEILACLAGNKGRVFSREMLLNQVWGSHVVVVDRTIDVHIRRIREKLGTSSGLLETIKGVGYRFRD